MPKQEKEIWRAIQRGKKGRGKKAEIARKEAIRMSKISPDRAATVQWFGKKGHKEYSWLSIWRKVYSYPYFGYSAIVLCLFWIYLWTLIWHEELTKCQTKSRLECALDNRRSVSTSSSIRYFQSVAHPSFRSMLQFVKLCMNPVSVSQETRWYMGQPLRIHASLETRAIFMAAIYTQ